MSSYEMTNPLGINHEKERVMKTMLAIGTEVVARVNDVNHYGVIVQACQRQQTYEIRLYAAGQLAWFESSEVYPMTTLKWLLS